MLCVTMVQCGFWVRIYWSNLWYSLANELVKEEIYKLKDGIDIDGIKVIPSRVKIRNKNNNKNTEVVEIGIVEGRNHIVKRIFESMGHKVIKLKREKYAFLEIENIPTGGYRNLTINEVKKLYNLKKSSK